MDISKKAKGENNEIVSLSSSKIRARVIKIGGLLSIIIGAIILVYPFLPYLKYKLFPPSPNYVSQNQIAQDKKGLASYLPLIGKKSNIEDKSGNRLIIPKIGVDTPIVEGENDKALLKGAWHLPSTSSPGEIGNVVITGHRFRFLPPNNTTFYLLDKLNENDEIIIIWEDSEYRYKVKEIKIVNPDQTEILAQAPKPTLTLFTCTPLFTTKQRLVVISELI